MVGLTDSNFRLGNKYTGVLLKGIEKTPLEKLNLRDNNLKGEEISVKLQECSTNIRELDLSENNIGKHLQSIKHLLLSKTSS